MSDVPIASVDEVDLVSALRSVIEKGLPTTETDAGDLLNLRSVYARAAVPSERRSRAQALNELLPRLIASIGDANYREAIQVLFGLAAGTRGAGLMERRRRAAVVLDYSLSHFREVKEHDLLLAVANVLHDDLLRYWPRVKRAIESLEPTGDTPALGPEHMTHEEELISRIWSQVYGLRAELIAVGRLQQREGHHAAVEDHRQSALRRREELQRLIDEYTSTYGVELIRHGEAEYAVDALERLAGWRT